MAGKRASSGSGSASVASSSAATGPMPPPTVATSTEGSTIAREVIDVDAVKDKSAASKRQKRTTSEAWNHFTRFEKDRDGKWC